MAGSALILMELPSGIVLRMDNDGQIAQKALLPSITLWHTPPSVALHSFIIPLLLLPYGRHMEASGYWEQCAVIHFGILLVVFLMRLKMETRTSWWDVVFVYFGPVLPAVAGIVVAVIRDAR